MIWRDVIKGKKRYGIIRMASHRSWKGRKKIDARLVPISALCTSVLVYFYNPFLDQSIQEWDGVVGRALIAGISVQHRTSNFTKLLLLLPILFFGIWILYSLLMDEHEAAIAFSQKYTIILAIPVINAYVNRYRGSISTVIPDILIISTFFYCLILAGITKIDRDKKFVREKEYTFYYLLYLIMILSVKILSGEKTVWRVGGTVALVLLIIVMIGIAADRKKKVHITFFNGFLSIFMWIPLIVCFTVEVLYILNARGIYFRDHRKIIYIVACCILLLQIAIMGYVMRRTRSDQRGSMIIGYWEQTNIRWGLLLSLGSVLSYVGYYVTSSYADDYSGLFEIGNGSASIDTFLRGKLPILDYFSGHAMMDVFARIPFMFLNGDSKASVASINILTPLILCVVFFLLARELFDDDTCLMLLFTYPFAIKGFIWCHLSMVAILATIHLIKQHTKRSYFIWWLALAVGVAIQYDRGMALGIGCIVAVIVLSLLKETDISLKKLCLSGVSVTLTLLVLCSAWWLHEGISPLFRIKEWISVSLGSSSTWALETEALGSPVSFAFEYTYFFIPALAILLILYALFKLFYYRRKQILCKGIESANLQDIALLIIFSVSVLLFMSRELTYHTLYNGSGTTGAILNFVPWMAMCTVMIICKEKMIGQLTRYAAMIFTMGLVIFNHTSNITKETPTASSTFLNSANAIAEGIILSDDMSPIWGTGRVVYSQKTQAFINQFKEIFDILLEDDETFCDFANASGLYAYLDRIRPCYLTQTPSLLTDEFSQDCYLEELSWYSVPLALVGNGPGYMESMNDIELNVRYWKVAEYIYENYRPLIQIGDFAIWCEIDRYDEFKTTLLQHDGLDGKYAFIDHGYDTGKVVVDENGNVLFEINEFGYHSYDIKLLPSIEAKYGGYDLEDPGFDLSAGPDRSYQIEKEIEIDKNTGYYLRFTTTRTETTKRDSTVILSDPSYSDILFRYDFLLSGEELVSDNLIRISGDYFWSTFDIDQIQFLVADDVVI